MFDIDTLIHLNFEIRGEQIGCYSFSIAGQPLPHVRNTRNTALSLSLSLSHVMCCLFVFTQKTVPITDRSGTQTPPYCYLAFV